MSSRVGDGLLALSSALLCSLAFPIRQWTGIASTPAWVLGGAVALMTVWTVVQRRGIQINLLLASAGGIATGLAITAILRRLELGQPVDSALPLLLPPVLLTSMYFRVEGRMRRNDEDCDRWIGEMEAIKALPPEEMLPALTSHAGQVNEEVSAVLAKWEKNTRLTTILIGAGMLLVLATIPGDINPEPRPVKLILDAVILTLGTVWFLVLAAGKWARK